MSTWSKRLGVLGKHKHLAIDIIDDITREPEALGGGGGVTVDNGVDAPAAVTTIVAPGWTLAGGTATTGIIVSETNPGAVGARSLWLRVNAGEIIYNLYLRNDANDDWLPVNQAAYTNLNDSTTITAYSNENQLTAWNNGAVIARFLASGGPSEPSPSVGHSPSGTLINFGPNASAHSYITGSADPSAGAGIAAGISSIYARSSGGVGQLWLKVGAANTAWQQVTTV